MAVAPDNTRRFLVDPKASISPLDETNPRSLWNLCPKEIRDYLKELDIEDWSLTEETYERKYGRVDPMVNRIRLEFWFDLDAAQVQMRRMDITNIAHRCGVPTSKVMKLLEYATNFIWVLIPPGTYDSYLTEAVQFGLQRIRRDILGAKIYNEDGDLNTKAADLLLKTVMYLDQRKNGAIVQRIDQRHVVENRDPTKITQQRSIADIDARIKQLQDSGVLAKATKVVEEAKAERYAIEPAKVTDFVPKHDPVVVVGYEPQDDE